MLPVLGGDPVERGVVEGEQHPVTGGMHVGLQVLVAEVHRVLERGQRVLQPLDLRVERTPAVGEGQDCAGLVEPRRPRNAKPVRGRVTRAVSNAM